MRQKLGQNFLWDNNIARKIVKALNIQPTDTVIEIGPGKGILTEQLLTQPGPARIIAIEIDKKLSQQLRKKFGTSPHLEIINDDFLKIDLPDFFIRKNICGATKFLGNLPYYAATAIIQKVISTAPKNLWQSAVFTLQKEVAEKISDSGKLNYLKIYIRHYCRVKSLFNITPDAFRPKPKVVSSVVMLEPLENISSDITDIKLARKIFLYRRKTLFKAMTLAGFKPEKTANILDLAGIDGKIRAEDLSLVDFFHLTTMSKKGIIEVDNQEPDYR